MYGQQNWHIVFWCPSGSLDALKPEMTLQRHMMALQVSTQSPLTGRTSGLWSESKFEIFGSLDIGAPAVQTTTEQL